MEKMDRGTDDRQKRVVKMGEVCVCVSVFVKEG